VRGERPGASTVRMGLSPGGRRPLRRPARAPVGRHHRARSGADRAAEGGKPAALRAESTSANNETQVTREIPGVRAADLAGASSVSLWVSWLHRRCLRGGAAAACPGRARRRVTCGLGRGAAVVPRGARAVARHVGSLRAPMGCMRPLPTRRPRGTPGPILPVRGDRLRGLVSTPATAQVRATTASPAACGTRAAAHRRSGSSAGMGAGSSGLRSSAPAGSPLASSGSGADGTCGAASATGSSIRAESLRVGRSSAGATA
jgi:hypothetical protein